MKIVPIDKPGEMGENVKKRIEDTLKLAKENGAINIAITMVTSTGDTIDCWANDNEVYKMIGALECLKLDFINVHVQKRDTE